MELGKSRNQALFPLLASQQGGVAASSIKCRAATEADAAGVVFLLFPIGKPPRPRGQRRLRKILLIARPPLLAVMQGGEYATPKRLDISYTAYMPLEYKFNAHLPLQSCVPEVGLAIPRIVRFPAICRREDQSVIVISLREVDLGHVDCVGRNG